MTLGYIGYDCVDIALANARMLAAAGKKVHVTDCTEKAYVLLAAGMEGSSRQGGIYHNVCLSAEHDVDAMGQFDYEIYYFGYNMGHPSVGKCGILYFVTDMLPCNAQILSQVEVGREGIIKRAILRNAIAVKYEESYLTGMMGQGIREEDTLVLMYDEDDYRSRCYLSIDARNSLKRLSRGMKALLCRLFSFCEEEYSRKDVMELLKKA